jgi:hypothetical protein
MGASLVIGHRKSKIRSPQGDPDVRKKRVGYFSADTLANVCRDSRRFKQMDRNAKCIGALPFLRRHPCARAESTFYDQVGRMNGPEINIVFLGETMVGKTSIFALYSKAGSIHPSHLCAWTPESMTCVRRLTSHPQSSSPGIRSISAERSIWNRERHSQSGSGHRTVSRAQIHARESTSSSRY